MLALSREENPTVFQKTLGLNDFYFSGGDDFEFPLGSIQMIGKSQAPMFRGERPHETLLAPSLVARQDGPSLGRLLALHRGPAPTGEPGNAHRATGTCDWPTSPRNDEPKARLLAKLKSLLGHLGMEGDHLLGRHLYMKNEIPVAGCAHQAGTCRFGADPASSVLDVNCKAHELDNLYVVDTSFFPSIGAVNPALTAMANALRVGDHLRDRLGANGSPTG